MSDKVKYYNPNIILNKKDLNGNEPNIFIITSNRSAGKTTGFLKKAIENYLKTGGQVALLYRFNYELSDGHKLFEEIFNLYPEYKGEMKSIAMARGLFYQMTYNDKILGYAIALNNVDSMKKYSALFSKIEMIIFDEYQTESGKYLPNEVKKFQSILMTIARGGGKQSRTNVKAILLGNTVTIMNPYLIEFDIHKRLQKDTRFIRGDGWIAEFSFNESASNSIKENGLFKGFKDGYKEFSTENIYLYNAMTFIDKPSGSFKYVCTILNEGIRYGVRLYWEEGILLINKKPDRDFKTVITFKNGDHNQNVLMANRFSWAFKTIKDAYYSGTLRFDDLKTKSMIFDILSIDVFK